MDHVLNVHALLCALALAGTTNHPLTLKAAIGLALEHSPAVQEGLIDVRMARAIGDEATAPFATMLQLNLNGQGGPAVNPQAPEALFASETSSAYVGQALASGVLALSRGFESGTSVRAGFSESFAKTPSIYQYQSPLWTSALGLHVDQQLWRGFGVEANTALIVSARAKERAAGLDLERGVQLLAGRVAGAYWQLASAQDYVGSQRDSLELGHRLKSLTETKIKLGALPAEALSQAVAAVARREAQLAAAERAAEAARGILAETLLIGDREVALEATDPLPGAESPAAGPLSVDRRPDVLAEKERFAAVQAAAIATADQSRPILTVGAGAELDGVAGSYNPTACALLQNEYNGGNTTSPLPASAILATCDPQGPLSGGLSNSLGHLFNGQAFQVFGTLTFQLPLELTAMRATAERAHLSVSRADQSVQQVEQAAMAEVARLTRLASENNRKVASTEAAARAVRALVDDEEKKYALGANTTFELVRAEDDLAVSQVLALQARLEQVLSQVELAVAQGRILETVGVEFTATTPQP